VALDEASTQDPPMRSCLGTLSRSCFWVAMLVIFLR